MTPETKLPDAAALRSWKEIAAFFGVSVRTAQKWEEERELPVHRLPGDKGRVYAHREELLAWQGGQPSFEDKPVDTGRRSVWRWAVIGLAALLVAACAMLAWYLLRSTRAMAGTRIEGNVLVALDAAGRELWRYGLPYREAAIKYRKPGDPERAQTEVIADVDGDGIEELVAGVETTASVKGSIFCFTRRGALRWQVSLGRAISSRNERFDSGFSLRAVHLVNLGAESGKALLVVASLEDYPCQVALLDPRGQLLREYWHSGHIPHVLVADLNGDGVDEVYAVGAANGYGRAVVVALDPRTMSGASREENPDFQLKELGAPVEIRRLLFSRLLEVRSRTKYNWVSRIRRVGEEIEADVVEAWLTDGLSTITAHYRLDRNLNPLSVSLDDMYEGSVHDLTGLYPTLRRVAEERLREGMRFIPSSLPAL